MNLLDRVRTLILLAPLFVAQLLVGQSAPPPPPTTYPGLPSETPTKFEPVTDSALPLRSAYGEPRFPAGPSDYGANPVELVSAIRSQSSDFRTKHFLGQARGLSEGGATYLPRARPNELHRSSSRHDALRQHGTREYNGADRPHQAQ